MSKYSYCGIDCEVCPAFTATQNNSVEEKTRLAEEWSKAFDCEIKADDIECDGCSANTGRVIDHWYECDIRKCAQTKAVTTCASCSDYGCNTLNNFLEKAPSVRENLEALRKEIK